MTKEQAKTLGEIVARINKLRDEVDTLSDSDALSLEGAFTDASDYLSLASTALNELLRE